MASLSTAGRRRFVIYSTALAASRLMTGMRGGAVGARQHGHPPRGGEGRLPSLPVWAQIPQPFEVKSIGGSTEMAVLIASIPAVGALVVVFLGELFQRRRFDRQREADDKRWEGQRDLERQRWADARDAERDKQLLTERLRTYAGFLAALEDLADAGKALARAGIRPQPQGTLEHFNRLIEALQSDPNDPAAAAETQTAIAALRPEAERWTSTYNATYRMGTQAALIASETCRDDVVEVLMFVGALAAPDATPKGWIVQTGVVGSGPVVSELWRHRNNVELIARRELGLTGQAVAESAAPDPSAT